MKADKLEHDEETAKESREAVEAEKDEKKKIAKQLMMVPQNGEEVHAQMVVVQNHIKDVSDSVCFARAIRRAREAACRVFLICRSFPILNLTSY